MEKYRAWNKKEKKMYYHDSWLIMSESDVCDWYNISPSCILIKGYFDYKDFVWMQYTGKGDFCEGDIIEYPMFPWKNKSEIGRCIIEKDNYGFIIKNLKGKYQFPFRNLDDIIDKVKKIGDKFQDSHLLDKDNGYAKNVIGKNIK